MTDARIEQVHADKITAREFLDQASDFLNDARIDGLGPPSRVVLLHNAAIVACDAILQAVGLRVTSGDRSHILRLETALRELDTDTTNSSSVSTPPASAATKRLMAAASSPKQACSTPKRPPPNSSNSHASSSARVATQPSE